MALTVELVDALTGRQGRAVLATATERLAAGEPELRVATALRTAYPAELVAAAMGQVELRAAARGKFSRAGAMLFTRSGLEQASGEPAARWRARRLRDAGRLADLCCGIGGDLVATGAALAVDVDPVHARLAAHNAEVYAVGPVCAVTADVAGVDLTGVEVAFVDPARRSPRGRHLGRHDPPLAWCFSLAARVGAVVVKAAPGLELAAVPAGWEVEFVADGRQLKEAVLWSPALAGAPRRASVLDGGMAGAAASFAGSLADAPEAVVAPPGGYLLDPSPAVTRAGLVTHLAATLGAWQIDERIAFLSGDAPMQTPFGRCLRVEASLPWHPGRLGAALRARDVGTVDLRRRGLAGDVERVRRSLKLRGSRRAVVAMTRAADRPWAIVATPVDEPPLPAPGS